MRKLIGAAALAVAVTVMPGIAAQAGESSSGIIAGAAPAKAGGKIWAERYNGPGNDVDNASAIGIRPDGSIVYVAGYSVGLTSGFDYGVVAYRAKDGAQLWAASYDGPPSGTDEAEALAVSPDGSVVFVTGWSEGAYEYADYATVAYDAQTGAELWESRYDDPDEADDYGAAIGVAPDGSKVFVTGTSYSFDGSIVYATVAYDASSGQQLWVDTYGEDSDAVGLVVAPNGSEVVVTGVSVGPDGTEDYGTIAYDPSTGAEMWTAIYDGPDHRTDWAKSVGFSPDGSRVFVAGTSFDSNDYEDFAAVAYNASDGTQLWESRSATPGFDTFATALGVSPDGASVYVTGDLNTGGGSLYETVAYSASDGTETWASTYGTGPGDSDSALALAIDPTGSSIFVTGKARGTYGTVAYDALTGSQLWAKGYSGGGVAHAIVSGPKGRKVFVTGLSNNDYATVAYKAS